MYTYIYIYTHMYIYIHEISCAWYELEGYMAHGLSVGRTGRGSGIGIGVYGKTMCRSPTGTLQDS